MAEKIIVRQDSKYRTLFLSTDPEDIQSAEFESVDDIHQLTPYGMMLCSLGSCTALVLNTYAQNHGLNLQEVEIHLDYQRVFREDCENCDEEQEYQEEISKSLILKGDLGANDQQKLLRISHYCPIYKILQNSMKLMTSLFEGKEEED